MRPKIIVIEPERRNAKLINSILQNKYTLCLAENISEGYSLITSENPDVLIINPQFPKSEGIDFIKEVRGFSDMPIIAVSSNGTERAAVSVIRSGADDFIRTPFFSGEFEARIDAAVIQCEKLKAAKGIDSTPCYEYCGLRLDFENRSLSIDRNHIHLTKNEYKIFELLCKNSGKVLTYDFILRSVWGPRTDSNTGILRVNTANLRKKLEADPLNPKYLFTENGIGYRVPENQSKLREKE